jgi:hypothetical protein
MNIISIIPNTKCCYACEVPIFAFEASNFNAQPVHKECLNEIELIHTLAWAKIKLPPMDSQKALQQTQILVYELIIEKHQTCLKDIIQIKCLNNTIKLANEILSILDPILPAMPDQFLTTVEEEPEKIKTPSFQPRTPSLQPMSPLVNAFKEVPIKEFKLEEIPDLENNCCVIL